jgi:hypothetical protein
LIDRQNQWWPPEFDRLEKNDIPDDRLIIELENRLAVQSLEEGARVGAAVNLQELLLLGYWPYEELRGYVNGESIHTESLIKKIKAQRSTIDRFPIHAFVAQPFEGRNNLFYEKIVKPSCYWEKVKPIRVDQMAPEQDLLEKAKKFMENAHLFIADLTRDNPNVYYEVGYLERAGIPGVFLSYEPGKSAFYMKYKDIVKISMGPDGIADCRKSLRQALKKILNSR